MHNWIGHATSHLARRSADDLPEDFSKQLELILKEIPAWGALILIFTVLAYFIVAFSVDYTLGVIFQLASVETPQQAIAIPNIQSGAPPAYKDTDPLTGQEVEEDPEVLLVPQKPITSSIRSTIRHLISIGGPTARWRGISLFLVTNFCVGLLGGVFSFLSPFVSAILATVILSHWLMGWTHIVISNPSSKPWYRRIPSIKTWKKIWAPTAMTAIACQAANVVPVALFFALQMHQFERVRDNLSAVDIIKLLVLALVFLALYIGIVVPAQVALTRVQSSMLPEDQDSIIPFDRTFGERVVSEVEGGSGKLSYRDAWKSIDKEARKRVIKLVVKSLMIEFAVHGLFFLLLVAEGLLIVLPAFRRARSGDAPSDDMKLF